MTIVPDRIEPEEEGHRTAKALRMLGRVELPFPRGVVQIDAGADILAAPGGQRLVSLLVHLLARMKGIVSRVIVPRGPAPRLPGVPVPGPELVAGLHELVDGLSGEESTHRVNLATSATAPDVVVSVGQRGGDIVVGSDAWRALIGKNAVAADWRAACPIGPYLAATIAAMEVLKRLLRLNFGVTDWRTVDDFALSAWNLGIGSAAEPGPDPGHVQLDDIGFAGAGAGGTATLFTLASFPCVDGRVSVVEPGSLKSSNLGRYLMSEYRQVHAALPKLESVRRFFALHAPAVEVASEPTEWPRQRSRWSRVVCMVDTPEGRRDVQFSEPRFLVEAGVLLGGIYAVLRVVPGGWCLECKHPPDPDITLKKRAARWGVSLESVRAWDRSNARVTLADVERLAVIQNRPPEDFAALVGMPFRDVPTCTECGETPLSLRVPSQAPVLPMATTAAGIVAAAEVVKEVLGMGPRLNNFLVHDLRHAPRRPLASFKPTVPGCARCSMLPRV